MKLHRNPSTSRIHEIIASSKHRAAKWLVGFDGVRWYWRPEDATHAWVARALHAPRGHEKGIAVSEDLPQ